MSSLLRFAGVRLIGQPPPTQTVIGSVLATVSGAVSVNNFPVTQPVSVASLPLPAGAALESGGNLAAIATLLGSLQRVLDLTVQVLAELEAARLQAAAVGGVSVEPASLLADGMPN